MSISPDFDSGWVTWISEHFKIHATPGYEIDGIPINLSDRNDINEEPIDVEDYHGDVPDVQTYFDIMEKHIGILLKRNDPIARQEKAFVLDLLAQKRKESDYPNDAVHDLIEAAWKYFKENNYDDPMEFGEMIGSELNDICLALSEQKILKNHKHLENR